MGEIIDKLKGKANQIKGTVTDDETTRTKGDLQEKKGEVKGGFERIKTDIKDTFDDRQV